MLKFGKFLALAGLAFWLTSPSLDGHGWDLFLIVFGVLTLMLNRPYSGAQPLDSVQATAIGLAEGEEEGKNQRRTRLLRDDPVDGCFEIKPEGTHRNPFGDPYNPFER